MSLSHTQFIDHKTLPWLTPRAVYIHIPFCAYHCGYCDFAVSTDPTLHELYLDALEIEMSGEPEYIDTIYIGGGTPTYLSLRQLERLFVMIQKRFPGHWRECTIESTAESISEEKLAFLKSVNVTRVSLGIQSFSNRTRNALDRRHGHDEIHNSINAIRKTGFLQSWDLIFAAPNQTIEDWLLDLEFVDEYLPEHVSTYCLTYEKGTPFWKMREKGIIQPVDEDRELEMYEVAIEHMSRNYEHYEISSFALNRNRCLHNEHYWANYAYHGFGVGAARYLQGTRAVNVRDANVYIRRIITEGDATQSAETLPPRERARETMAVQLRRCDGIQRESFRKQTGFELDEFCESPLRFLVGEGLMTDTGNHVRISRRGRPLADGIIARLLQG